MRVKKAKRRPGRPEFIADAPKNAAPKGAKLRAEQRNESQEFGGKRVPPAHVLDAIAERTITGGFKTREQGRKPCKSCFQFRSANGSCGCRSRTSDRKVGTLTTLRHNVKCESKGPAKGCPCRR